MKDSDWHDERRKGIGSSDAAAVCDLSPWKTPLDVYSEKLGLSPPRPPSEAMAIGTALEPVIADLYTMRTGFSLYPPQQRIATCPFAGWMKASIDRVRDDGGIVEIKCAGPFGLDEWGDDGSDKIPRHYLIQVTHQMVVMGQDVCDVAALLAGTDFRIYTVKIQPSLAEKIYRTEEAFWKCVLGRTPPPPNTGWDKLQLDQVFAMADTEVDLGAGGLDLVRQWEDAKAKGKILDGLAKEIRNKLLWAMGDNKVGLLPDGRKLVRSTVTKKAYSVASSAYQTLTLKGDVTCEVPIKTG